MIPLPVTLGSDRALWLHQRVVRLVGILDTRKSWVLSQKQKRYWTVLDLRSPLLMSGGSLGMVVFDFLLVVALVAALLLFSAPLPLTPTFLSTSSLFFVPCALLSLITRSLLMNSLCTCPFF